MAKKAIDISAIGLFISVVLYLIYALVLAPMDVVSTLFTNPMIGYVFRSVVIALFITLLVAACIRLLISPFMPSDEEKAFRQKVEYVLSQRKHFNGAPKQGSVVRSPLQNMTAEEEQIVCRMLCELPEHISKQGHINLAQTMHYLTALQQLGYLNDKDLYNLREWLIQITGRTVPTISQFNEAYPSKAKKKVEKAKQEIMTALAKLR